MARILTLYSRANSRAREAGRDLVEELERARTTLSGPGGVLAIVFGRGSEDDAAHTVVDVADGPNLPWLRERLVRAGLLGIEFLPGLTLDSVLDLTERLVRRPGQCEEGLEADLEELGERGGFRPVELLFEGGFDDALEASDVTASERELASGLGPGEERLLAEVLLQNEEVLQRLEALQLEVDLYGEEGEWVDATDLLQRIVDLLPAEAFEDVGRALELTKAVLEGVMQDRGRAGQHESAMLANRHLAGLLHETGQNLFARAHAPVGALLEASEDAPRQTLDAKARGHAGDDAITEDIDAFLEELEQLPAEEIEWIHPDDIDKTAEQLGVVLHHLVHAESDDEARLLHPILERLMALPGPEEITVLRAYLCPEEQECEDPERVLVRVGTFLRETNLQRLLRDAGALEVGWVLRTFPDTFPLYLDGLDLGDEGQLHELEVVCERLGSVRILAAGDRVFSLKGLQDPHRIERICSSHSPSVAPLVRVILRNLGLAARMPVIDYVRRVWPDRRECCAVLICNPEDISASYLLALLQPHSGVEGARDLGRRISMTLTRFVRECGRDRDLEARRIAAIRALADYPSPAACELLAELAWAKRIPFLDRESAEVRRAARAASEAIVLRSAR